MRLLKEAASLIVRQATINDLDALVPLFDAYRQFYKQASDPDGARAFLEDRFEHQQSIVFVACDVDQAVGFTQLFPSFSSTRMARTFILNDLFVSPAARRTGAGRALLNAACEYGRAVGASRLSLSTAVANVVAQSVYEKAGWTRDTEFQAYAISLI
ncbi:GNAT family N-acetyltransferase [Sphingomonas sp. DC1100-1]|uniref:GNAT family N-acetyltransferase n=1 Tax=unclassified Sphingomonas TaxID=196159 RepID=UPI003CEE1AB6